MNLNAKDNIFRVLEQDGPFATRETAPGPNIFSSDSRQMAARLSATKLTTRYRIVRDQIFELLDINTFADAQALIDNEQQREKTNCRAYGLFARMFGIKGGKSECGAAIKRYSSTADEVIRYLKSVVLAPYESYFHMTDKLYTISDPVELLLILFDDRYHQKARFEAKRKLVLMSLAAAIEQREQQTEVEKKFAQFLDFLNNHVWSQDAKIGEREPAFLLSHHDPEDFSCCEVKVLPWDKAAGIQIEPGMKRTLIKRLWFQANDRKVPIYVTVRKKEPAAKVLKLLRKGEENPDVAVDDELGLMGVLDQVSEVRMFQKHLVESASRAGSFLTLEDISNTLDGSSRACNNPGSSTKTPMLKFFARLGGMRVEFLLHTNASFLNYIYQRGVSHDEYEVRRLFDSGIASLLFPQDIYLLDMNSIRNDLLDLFRRRIETEV